MDFSSETIKTRSKRNNIFQVLKEKNSQPRILYPANVSIKNEGRIRALSEEGTLREFVTGRPTLKEWLRKFLKWEEIKKEGI